ncbi:hypothetical protein EG329_001946 [Mollisiaceae sp. DMI_Dod_QoI]|nr:hypothetical protein EG329_001946 [Helotiales sp. DMI_Dod_QoI]
MSGSSWLSMIYGRIIASLSIGEDAKFTGKDPTSTVNSESVKPTVESDSPKSKHGMIYSNAEETMFPLGSLSSSTTRRPSAGIEPMPYKTSDHSSRVPTPHRFKTGSQMRKILEGK